MAAPMYYGFIAIAVAKSRIFHAFVPNHYKIGTLAGIGLVAQRLEQRTHNPSIGTGPQRLFNHLHTIERIGLACFGTIFRGFGSILGPSFGTTAWLSEVKVDRKVHRGI